MKIKKIIAIIMMLLIVLLTINPITMAKINPDTYKPSSPSSGDVDKIVNKVNPIVGTLKTVGIVVAVVTLMVIGIKYMTGSISEKAEYKKTMIPYLVGAILVVAITQILGVVIEIIIKVQ